MIELYSCASFVLKNRYPKIIKLSLARALGFEPRSKVLETSILPLNYARSYQKIVLKWLTQLERKYPDGYPGTFLLCFTFDHHLTVNNAYFRISVTCPAPTVRPPSRIANFNPFSIAIGWMSFTVMLVLSPGITISVPSGSSHSPVTSVVRK